MHSSPCLLIAVLLVGLSDFQTSAFAPTFRHHQQQHHQHLLLRPVAAVTTRRHHGQQPRPRCGILNAAASDEDPDVIQIESLASEQIAELIEVTFINACMQLAQGYVDVLKLFIVAVKASYERGTLTIDELVHAVDTCPVNTAGRPLIPAEVGLRTTWIHATYWMLGHVMTTPLGSDLAKAAGVNDNVKDTYTSVIPDLVALHANGGTLNTQEFVQDHLDILPAVIQEDAMQMAIVSQTIKVMWYALVVLDEERLANGEEPPRPNIPRGKGII